MNQVLALQNMSVEGAGHNQLGMLSTSTVSVHCTNTPLARVAA